MSTAILRAPVSSLSFCLKVERRDGAGIALTGHDTKIMAGGTSFHPAAGLEPSAIVKGEAGEPVGDCAGSLTSSALTEADLLSGRWDRAATTLLAADWMETATASWPLAVGELGEVSVDGRAFTAQLLGSAVWLQEPVAPTTSPECRASLGDRKCRVDLAGRRKRLEVVAVDGPIVTFATDVSENFRLGIARWIRGANTGLQTVVVDVAGSTVTLREVPFFPAQRGDCIILTEGCDKRFETCSDRFWNALNFRGEPHLPGNDLLTRYPGN